MSDIIHEIKNILSHIQGLETILYDNSFSVNVRLDRKPTPAAIIYQTNGFTVDTSSGLMKESADFEIFFCNRTDFQISGEPLAHFTKPMKQMALDFISGLMDLKDWVVVGDKINCLFAVGKFDANVSGYTVQFSLIQKQGRCF